MVRWSGAACRRARTGSVGNEENDLLLSQLTHGSYCLRRFALVTNELIWAESTDTAKGHMEHERTHTRRMERRGSEVKLYGFEVRSEKMGLHGACDCIEASESPSGCMVPGIPFPVQLYPVEYKHGRVRQEEEYELQLCAQAMCLEEMFQTEILEGALYYTSSHRRYPVKLTGELRQKVIDMVEKLRRIRESNVLPKAEYGPKCKKCSLREQCLPRLTRTAAAYCLKVEQEAREVSRE